MQKMGLDGSGSSRAALELESIKETLNALHLSGKRLTLCLEIFSRTDKLRASKEDLGVLLDAIADSIHGLLVQREFLGFHEGNLEWVRRHYEVPEEAYARLDKRARKKGLNHSLPM